jgi:hypothetical protein
MPTAFIAICGNCGRRDIPVFSLALVRGQLGSRRWLVYAHSPLDDRHGVQRTLPEFGTLTLNVPRAGVFSVVEEQSRSIRPANTSVSARR